MKNNLPLAPKDITGQINYATGSIVSKILLDSPNLQITLFAVDKTESFGEHTSSREVLVHILEGECEFSIGDVPHKCLANSYFYMPQGQKHSIKALTQFKFLLYQY